MAGWKQLITSGSTPLFGGLTSSLDLVPRDNNQASLGTDTLEWKDLYIDGTAYLDGAQIGTLGAALNANSQAITNANIDTGDIASDVTINKSPTVNFNSGDVNGSITLSNLAGGTGALTIQSGVVENSMLASALVTSISGSLGENAALIRTLTATGISGSFTDLSSSLAS